MIWISILLGSIATLLFVISTWAPSPKQAREDPSLNIRITYLILSIAVLLQVGSLSLAYAANAKSAEEANDVDERRAREIREVTERSARETVDANQRSEEKLKELADKHAEEAKIRHETEQRRHDTDACFDQWKSGIDQLAVRVQEQNSLIGNLAAQFNEGLAQKIERSVNDSYNDIQLVLSNLGTVYGAHRLLLIAVGCPEEATELAEVCLDRIQELQHKLTDNHTNPENLKIVLTNSWNELPLVVLNSSGISARAFARLLRDEFSRYQADREGWAPKASEEEIARLLKTAVGESRQAPSAEMPK